VPERWPWTEHFTVEQHLAQVIPKDLAVALQQCEVNPRKRVVQTNHTLSFGWLVWKYHWAMEVGPTRRLLVVPGSHTSSQVWFSLRIRRGQLHGGVVRTLYDHLTKKTYKGSWDFEQDEEFVAEEGRAAVEVDGVEGGGDTLFHVC